MLTWPRTKPPDRHPPQLGAIKGGLIRVRQTNPSDPYTALDSIDGLWRINITQTDGHLLPFLSENSSVNSHQKSIELFIGFVSFRLVILLIFLIFLLFLFLLGCPLHIWFGGTRFVRVPVHGERQHRYCQSSQNDREKSIDHKRSSFLWSSQV